MTQTQTQTQVEHGGSNPPMSQLAKVQCISFSSGKERKRNMRWCMDPARGFKRIMQLGLDNIAERHDIAIVAGGPTLNETYKELKNFKYIMSCGSSHDHVLKLGIKPTFHIECDPHTEQLKNYKTRPEHDIKYLVSTRCHRHMFSRLDDYGYLYLWNMWESDLGKPIYRGEPAFICGATVTLSAIPVALTLGWKHLHFFGFDGSFPSKDQHHAYPQAESAQFLEVVVGDPVKGRKFLTTATWASQAQQFEDMRNHWKFDCTIYGDSLQAEMERWRTIEIKAKEATAAALAYPSSYPAFNQTKEGVAA